MTVFDLKTKLAMYPDDFRHHPLRVWTWLLWSDSQEGGQVESERQCRDSHLIRIIDAWH